MKYIPTAMYVYNGNCVLKKINIGGLEQKSGIVIINKTDQIFSASSVGLIFLKKKSVNIWG
jgi:hypothetical protein